MANGDRRPPVEAIAILDVVATDVYEIEDMGHGLRRIIFTSPHAGAGGGIERHTVFKLVLPEACLVPISRKFVAAAEEVMETMLTLVPNGRKQDG